MSPSYQWGALWLLLLLLLRGRRRTVFVLLVHHVEFGHHAVDAVSRLHRGTVTDGGILF